MADLHPTSGSGDRAGAWLTPTAVAIAAFTVAVLSLVTNGTWALAAQAFISRNGSGAYSDVVMATGFTQLLLAALALILVRRVLGSPVATARSLGGATVILGVLGLVIGVLTIAAGLLSA
ncbi:MAG: hypothetical protein HYU55_03760 [Nocardioides sp.]|nr:hypothetical protein [Nocardioides sp.]